MAWYRAGTVAVTNGSAIVTGTNTDFVSNTQVGEIFVGPDLKVYEVDIVTSATQISIKPAYQSASGGGQAYGIAPTQSFARDLALAFAGFKNTFGGILDTIGQGMFPDGTVAAPGFRFAADQDTGWRRPGANSLALVTGGIDRMTIDASGQAFFPTGKGLGVVGLPAETFTMSDGQFGPRLTTEGSFRVTSGDGTTERLRVDPSGSVGIGTATPASFGGYTSLTIGGAGHGLITLRSPSGQAALLQTNFGGIGPAVGTASAHPLLFAVNSSEAARIDANGNFLIGASSGSAHTFFKAGVGIGGTILQIAANAGDYTATFYGVDQGGANGAATGLRVGRNGSTGRSISAGGTINASGADYAEYVRKSLACGTILKGDVCGIDSDGQLTRTWADAHRYVVKSTDPNLVGGDTWSAHLGPRPEAPVYAAPAYDGPAEPTKPVEPAAFVPPVIEVPVQPVRADGEDDEAYLLRLAAFLNDRAATIAQAQAAADAQVEAAKAQVAYAAAAGQYQADLEAYRDAQAAHRTAVEAAEAAHAVALTVHGEALTAWEGELEAARQTVDRIAFSGQVPVNVDADTLAACEAALGDGVAVYLVAVARGAGIGVTAVREADMTLQQYMRRLGAVWAIRDGRPWIDVQHG
jgi:hypothetical protein